MSRGASLIITWALCLLAPGQVLGAPRYSEVLASFAYPLESAQVVPLPSPVDERHKAHAHAVHDRARAVAIYAVTRDATVHVSCDAGTTWRRQALRIHEGMALPNKELLETWTSELFPHAANLSFNTQRIFGLQGNADQCVQTHCPASASFRRHGDATSRTLRAAPPASGVLSSPIEVGDGPFVATSLPTVKVNEHAPRMALLEYEGATSITRDCGATWTPTTPEEATRSFEEEKKASARTDRRRRGATEAFEGDPFPGYDHELFQDGAAASPALTKLDLERGARVISVAKTGARFKIVGTEVAQSSPEGDTWEPVPYRTPFGANGLDINAEHPREWAAMGGSQVWVSEDRGNSFSPLYLGPHAPRSVLFRNNLLYVTTEREVLRVSREPSSNVNTKSLLQLRDQVRKEPTLAETITGALRYLKLDPEEIRAQGSPELMGLLPKLGLGVVVFTPSALTQFDSSTNYPDESVGGEVGNPFNTRGVDWNRLYRPWNSLDQEFLLNRSFFGVHFFAGVVARWNTDELVGSPSAAMVENVVHGNESARQRVIQSVQSLYTFRQQLMIRFFSQPPVDVETRTAQLLEVEELTAQLRGLCPDLWQPALEWITRQHKEIL